MADRMKLLVHMYCADERTKLGEFNGVEIWADKHVPDDEVRIVMGNRMLDRFTYWAALVQTKEPPEAS